MVQLARINTVLSRTWKERFAATSFLGDASSHWDNLPGAQHREMLKHKPSFFFFFFLLTITQCGSLKRKEGIKEPSLKSQMPLVRISLTTH